MWLTYDPTSDELWTGLFISQERMIKLNNELDTIAKRMRSKDIKSVLHMLGEINTFCNNIGEVNYCVYLQATYLAKYGISNVKIKMENEKP